MNELSDHELLRRYATTGEEAPFTELVRRHLNLVWGAARRTTRDGDSARDVAQVVFVDLARRARHLSSGTVLEGWLYRAACHAAAKHVRTETRRTQRERLVMQDPSMNPSAPDDVRVAEALQPELDAALAMLGEVDRDAVVLRFLAGRSLAEVGRSLGINEDAAQKRVTRALDRLREQLRRRGLAVGAGLVQAALSAAAGQVAPTGVAGGISSAAVMATGAVGLGWWERLMLMKTKLAVRILAGGALLASVGGTWQSLHRSHREVADLRLEVARLNAELIVNSTDRKVGGAQTVQREDPAERLRLRAKVAEMQGELKRLREKLGGSGLQAMLAPRELGFEETREPQIWIVHAAVVLGGAAIAYAANHNETLPPSFEEMKAEIDLPTGGAFIGGIRPEVFELFPHQRPISPSETGFILLREKSPRRTLTGVFERVYCMVDGGAREVVGLTEDFSEYEDSRRATLANLPKKP